MGSILHPRECVRNIHELTPDWLKKRGITALICDLDDTLMPYHTTKWTPELTEWLQNLKNAGISICVLSNGKARRIRPVCAQNKVKCVPMAFKPLPFGFMSATKKLRATDKNKVAVVGDQIFTDILGGNLVGMYTILVDPIALKPNAPERFKRRCEVKFRKSRKKQE